MDKEKLKEIIDSLDRLRNDVEASFGIHQFGDAPDESYIKANKEGLIRFAREMLAATNEKITSESSEKTIYILTEHDDDDDWLDYDGSTFVEYIEVVDKHDVEPKAADSTVRSKMQEFGCVVVMIGILLIFIVGIVSVINWFF